MKTIPFFISTGLLTCLGACSSLVPPDLPDKAPPLADMKEPIRLHEEPADEAERVGLPAGGFTGVVIGTGFRTLDAPREDEPGLLVKEIVLNSPADAAGLREGDLLLYARDAKGKKHVLVRPSQWRKLEIDAAPGSRLTVTFDRAGVEREVEIGVIPRLHPPDRTPVERYREENRVGVVIRTATEVEARRNGLGPGGGAVIVGLSRRSPWRKAGLRYRDLLVAVGGKPVTHPQVVLDAIREGGDSLEVVYVRNGERKKVRTKLTRREHEIRRVNLPLLFFYESDRGATETSFLSGLLRKKTTPAAWEWRFLWLFRIRGGDADRLEKVEE